MKKLAIVGAGELGTQICSLAKSTGKFNVVGFFDDYNLEKSFFDTPILGKIVDILSVFNSGAIDCVVLAIGYKHLEVRKKIFNELKGKVPFATIIHNSCLINPSAIIGEGCVIYPGCIIDKNVQLCDNVLLNLGVIVSHDSRICSHSYISPGVVFSGFVDLGECVFVGSNSTFVDNISIVGSSFFGAGSLVYKKITIKGKYIGNPVKLISD